MVESKEQSQKVEYQRQVQPSQTNEVCTEEQKVCRQVILGFDPGHIKMGVAVIDFKDASIIETQCVQLKKQGQKQTQTQVEAQVNANLKRLIDSLYDKYYVCLVVIELQMGQFSVTNIQTAIVSHLKDHTNFVVQHSKLKLKHPEAKNVDNANKESKQYNQNKMLGRLLAQHIYKDFTENNYDQCDALLHANYVFRNKDNITFVTKNQYNNIQ